MSTLRDAKFGFFVHWKISSVPAYPGDQKKRVQLSLDSPIRELLDDAEAMPRVLAAIRQHGTELADQVLAQEGLSVRQAVSFMPKREKILASIAEALGSL